MVRLISTENVNCAIIHNFLIAEQR